MNNEDEEQETPEPSMTSRQMIATGVMWFLIWLGWGSCCYLSSTSGPIIKIERSSAEGGK